MHETGVVQVLKEIDKKEDALQWIDRCVICLQDCVKT